MNYSNISQFSIINNIPFQSQINHMISYNAYNYPNYINQKNISYMLYQNYIQYQNPFFKQKKELFYKKRNDNTNYSTIQKVADNANENHLLKKEENIYEKINSIKIDKKRRPSIDTTISSDSFNSSSNDEKENENDDSDETKKNEKKDEIYGGNPELENTEILRVNVKISKDKEAVFKLKRYDDIFETIKLFCEINLIDEKLIKPLIIKSLSALNTIYQIMNSKLDNSQINLLKRVQSI